MTQTGHINERAAVHSGAASLVLDAHSSGGVSVERVDAETLRVVNALFPQGQGDQRRGGRRQKSAPATRHYARHSGYAFLLAFLALARADQYILPTLRETAVAVLSGNNVRDVARLLGWSYEVTNQYFILWTTLNLLLQERSGRQVTYLFPLTCYTPRLSTVRALDALIAEDDPRKGYREAVKKLAVRVRARFLDYYGISPAVLTDLERLDSPALVQALQGTGSLLATCGIEPAAAQRLSLDIVLQVFAPLLATSGREMVLLPGGRVNCCAQNLEVGSTFTQGGSRRGDGWVVVSIPGPGISALWGCSRACPMEIQGGRVCSCGPESSGGTPRERERHNHCRFRGRSRFPFENRIFIFR